MDNKKFLRRSGVLAGLLALLLLGVGAQLYDVQIIHGDYWSARSSQTITDTETVISARGEILDRYGRLLVTNRVTYQVSLNTSLMGGERNKIISELLKVAEQSDVEWEDTLPVSARPPFAYVGDTPFYTVSTGEDGAIKKTLTRLGRLAVKQKWLSGDPSDEGKTVPLPTAKELLEKMYASFGIEEEDQTRARALAGVLYEMYLRAKEIDWNPYVFAEGVDIDFISRVKERGLPGVEIEAHTARQYNTDYAAHLLGRIGPIYRDEWEYYKTVDADGDGVADYQLNDTVGKEGAEMAFESYLRGSPGERQVDRNTSGRVVGETWTREPEPGDNVVLTIDIDLQQAVEDILAEGLPRLASDEVEGAACVVLDVNSAEILSSASYPTYRLESYGKDYSENAANPLKPFVNRAFKGVYAPGSTFKMVTAVAGLEMGIITPATRIRDTGVYTYYNKNGPMCWLWRQFRSTHGLENVSQAIRDSCNVFFYDVGRQVTIHGLREYAALFGLGASTGIELPESVGVMAGPKNEEEEEKTWQPGSTLSVAIGQENSQFTPLQLANYIATLVNGGTHRAVHLLKSVKSSDYSQVLYTQEPEVLGAIDMAPENLEAVKKGMLMVTTEGSVARYFRDLDVAVGAKTGSAQVSVDTQSNAIFVCFAPYDDPQVAVAIAVEHGGSGTDVGAIASEILQYYFSAEQNREEILTENTLIR